MNQNHHGAPRRPLIGLTPDFSEPEGQPFPLYELKLPYAEAVLKAGGLPIVLPYADDPSVVQGYLDRIQGLVVTGGAFDIPPAHYGEEAREGLGPLKPLRTAFESALMRGALARQLPLLGICGGMQLLNVILGGTLYQDVDTEVPGVRPHQQTHDRSQPHHPVEVKDHTLLAEALGRGQLMVNSTHHQAVKALGREVVASATSPDGLVEAIEGPGPGLALGVQWHPEYLLQSVPLHLGIYKLLVQRARDYRR